MPRVPGTAHALHQADWLAGRLRGVYGDSDENNALKLGYDPVARAWPAWMGAFGHPQDTLPRVHPAGTVLGDVDPAVVRRFGWSPQAQVVSGTTDGVAAFLATGASEPGDAVTSLGTTLVLKQWCPQPLSDARCGIYSHRVGDLWLAGGASNSGGAALLGHFTLAQMQAMTPQLDPDRPTGLDYYPLPRRGERFPVNDPLLEPRTHPRPADDLRFFQALLEGIAGIERRGYERLQALGGPPLRSVRTVGGGASNAAWSRLRQRSLSVPFLPSRHQDAACGSACLAWRGLRAAGLAAGAPDFNPESP
jgi:D-ribulokinase